jgi:cyclophilin family peptidyl-prolyl cis-trans isomerase
MMFTKMKGLCLLIVIVMMAALLFAEEVQKKDDTGMTNLMKKTVNVVMKTSQGTIELELWPDMAPKTVDNFVKLSNEGFYEKTYFHRVIPDFMIQGGDPNTKDTTRTNDGQGGPGYKFEDEAYINGEPLTGAITDEETARTVWSDVILPYIQNTAEPDTTVKAVFDAVIKAQSGAPIMEHPIEWYLTKTHHEGVLAKKVVKHPVSYGTICMANSGPDTNGSQFFIVTKEDGADWLNGKHTVFGKVTKGMDIVLKIQNLPRDKSDNPLVGNQAFIDKITISK